jgi:hypothetical protein
MERPEACEPVYIHKDDRRVWVTGFEVPAEVLASF